MPLLQYRHSPAFAAEFAAVLPSFGASTVLTEWATQYAQMHAGRCLWDAQFIGRHAVRRCLNVGAAPYLFEFALRKDFPGIDLTSMDLHPERFPNAGQVLGIRIVRGNIEADEHLVDETFDLVIFTEIFEHLRIDMLATLARVRSLLAADGRLYLSMPNGAGFTAWRRRVLRGRTGPPLVEEWSKLSRLGHMGHVREYSLLEAVEVLVHCGFAIEDSAFRVLRTRVRPLRDLLITLRPALADEVMIIARNAQAPALPNSWRWDDAGRAVLGQE